MSPNIILMGDFNIHFDNTDSTFTKDFKAMLDCLNLTQHVNFTTPREIQYKGLILDLVCRSDIAPFNITPAELPISDHKAVLFNAFRSRNQGCIVLYHTVTSNM